MRKFFSAAAISNLTALAAPIASICLLPPLLAAPFVVGGVALTVFSGGFHAIQNLRWQKLDVWAVMVQIFAVGSGLIGAIWNPIIGCAFFVSLSVGYFPIREAIDSTKHFIGWVLAFVPLLFFVLGAQGAGIVLFVLSIALVAKAVERFDSDVGAHGPTHGLGWHVPIQVVPLLVVILL